MAKYTIDATGKKLGRLASEAAILLIGKNVPSFQKHILRRDVEVEIVNASKINITPKKAREKTYLRYSGYPGGLREETFRQLAHRKGYGETIRKAIHGMLPANKLRPKKMKQLHISE